MKLPALSDNLGFVIRGFGRDVLGFPLRAVRHVWRNRRYLTYHKLVNIAIVNVEYLLRRPHMIGRPYDIKLEPTNICNSTCRLCPTGIGLRGRPKGCMPFDTYRQIIDRIKHHTYILDLSNWGDPLIAPEIYDMIRYAHDARIWTYLSTNLHALRLDAGDAERLVGSGLDMLNCSVHATTESAYQAYQPGKQLAPVLDRVRAIVDAKRRLKSSRPVVRLFLAVGKHNEHEVAAFRRLSRELGCEPVFTHVSLNLRFIGHDKHLHDLGWSTDQKRCAAQEIADRWLPRNPKWVAPWYRRGQALQPPVRTGRCNKLYRCDWPWRKTVINFDGAVTACCGVFNPKWQMGNIVEQPFNTVWNGPTYRRARESFTRAVEAGCGEPCRRCPGVLM